MLSSISKRARRILLQLWFWDRLFKKAHLTASLSEKRRSIKKALKTSAAIKTASASSSWMAVYWSAAITSDRRLESAFSLKKPRHLPEDEYMTPEKPPVSKHASTNFPDTRRGMFCSTCNFVAVRASASVAVKAFRPDLLHLERCFKWFVRVRPKSSPWANCNRPLSFNIFPTQHL